MEDCIKCGMSLSGGDLTLPWEDDDNPNAYVICPHCGYKNTVYGYGEDDDRGSSSKGIGKQIS